MDRHMIALEAVMAKRPAYVRKAAEDHARALDEPTWLRLKMALQAYEESKRAAQH